MSEYEEAVCLVGEEVAQRLVWISEREELSLRDLALHAARIRMRAREMNSEFRKWWPR